MPSVNFEGVTDVAEYATGTASNNGNNTIVATGGKTIKVWSYQVVRSGGEFKEYRVVVNSCVMRRHDMCIVRPVIVGNRAGENTFVPTGQSNNRILESFCLMH